MWCMVGPFGRWVFVWCVDRGGSGRRVRAGRGDVELDDVIGRQERDGAGPATGRRTASPGCRWQVIARSRIARTADVSMATSSSSGRPSSSSVDREVRAVGLRRPPSMPPIPHQAAGQARVDESDGPVRPRDGDRERIAEVAVVAMAVAAIERQHDVRCDRRQSVDELVGDVVERSSDQRPQRSRSREAGVDVVHEHHLLDAEHDGGLAQLDLAHQAERPGVGHRVGSTFAGLTAGGADDGDVAHRQRPPGRSATRTRRSRRRGGRRRRPVAPPARRGSGRAAHRPPRSRSPSSAAIIRSSSSWPGAAIGGTSTTSRSTSNAGSTFAAGDRRAVARGDGGHLQRRQPSTVDGRPTGRPSPPTG